MQLIYRRPGDNKTQVEHIRTANPIAQAGKPDRNTRMTPEFKIKQEVKRRMIENLDKTIDTN